MLKHFYLILTGTFIIGFCAGVYIYFVSRGPIEPRSTTVTGEFEIIGDEYGGCEFGGRCSSYRILENGTYTYLIRDREDEDKRFEDVISDNRLDELAALLERTDLSLIEGSTFIGTCPIAFDGMAYRYEITYQGTLYSIDTCREDVSNAPLFELLTDYFAIFRLVHGDE